MDGRERVIKGMESLKKRLYNSKNILDGGIVGNALALLKSQEPRVMTLEEVKRLTTDNDVWIEYHELAGWTISAVTVREIDDNGMLCRLQCLRFGFDRYGCYGGDWMAWRCWTRRPTDEQREVTKWN